MRRPLVLLALMLGLAGCATDRPLAFACPRFGEFRTPLPATPAGAVGRLQADPLVAAVRAAFAAPAPARRAGPPAAHLLILSGGGQWGAYGAGLLDGWRGQAGPNARPDFQVVTGVSTGAMQATFAFLGQEPDMVAAYRIAQESDLAVRHGALFFLNHASLADLAPLRERVLELATDARLDAVADQGRAGRRLYVGAVDALDGAMYAIDLTAMADKLRDARDERRECYAGAILASAAIPLVFRQVTVNGTPYYDGGVRQSVFVARFQEVAARAMAARPAAASETPPPPGAVYILLNGVPGVTPKAAVKPQILPTLGRLRAIAFEQVDQSSIYAAHLRAKELYGTTTTYVATAAGHGCAPPADDDAIFDPAFMACLIDRGRARWTQGSPWTPYPPTP